MHDSFGDGWNGGTLDISSNGVNFLSGAYSPWGTDHSVTFDVALPIPQPPPAPPLPPAPHPPPGLPAPTIQSGDYLLTLDSASEPTCCSQHGLAVNPETGPSWPVVTSGGHCGGGLVQTTEEWIDMVTEQSPDDTGYIGICLSDGYYSISYNPAPTSAPTSVTWHLASDDSSCTNVCSAINKTCDSSSLQYSYIQGSGDYAGLYAAFSAAGVTCSSGGSVGGNSGPMLYNGNCYQNEPTTDQQCSAAAVFSSGNRVCPCSGAMSTNRQL
jgi:hypothetical protein